MQYLWNIRVSIPYFKNCVFVHNRVYHKHLLAAILCQPPQSNPVNGDVSCTNANRASSVCTFSCASGFALDGRSTTVCLDDGNGDALGVWSNFPAVCRRKYAVWCPVLSLWMQILHLHSLWCAVSTAWVVDTVIPFQPNVPVDYCAFRIRPVTRNENNRVRWMTKGVFKPCLFRKKPHSFRCCLRVCLALMSLTWA